MTESSDTVSKKRSSFPSPKRMVSQEVFTLVDDIIRRDYLLDPLKPYTIFTEGNSDCEFIRTACLAIKVEWGIDLLTIDMGGTSHAIYLQTPKKPEAPDRGGVQQLVRLGEELSVWKNRIDFPPVAFLFDHDKAGKDGREKLRGSWKDNDTCISLDPRLHDRCQLDHKNDEVDMESLIDIEFQACFFNDLRSPTAWVHFKSGAISQIKWEHPSKSDFWEYVGREARAVHLLELGRVVSRIREAWGVPIPYPPSLPQSDECVPTEQPNDSHNES